MNAIEIAGAVVALLGAAVVLVGTIGIVRMPDLFTRMHAAGVVDTLGAFLVLAGLCLVAGIGTESGRMLLVLAFLWLTGTTGCHALAKSARAAGEQPQVAPPEPGDRTARERADRLPTAPTPEHRP